MAMAASTFVGGGSQEDMADSQIILRTYELAATDVLPVMNGHTTDIVKESRFLRELPRAAAHVLAASARARLLAPKQCGARQGDPARALTWIHSGLLSVFYESDDGSISPHRIVWPNEVSCLGLSAGAEYPASSRALTPVTYYWVSEGALDPALRQVPELAHSLLCYLARQEERSAVWSTRLLSLPVRGRLRFVLARMVGEMGRPHDDAFLLDFAVTNTILSELTHVSRDEVGRAVRELVAKGIIQRLRGRRLLVTDPSKLLGPRLVEPVARLGLLPGAGRSPSTRPGARERR
jgi:CRP-like cAMP-binding protein